MKDEIYEFWFGRNFTFDQIDERNKFWFGKNEQIDAEIKERFEPVLLKGVNGELEDWKNSPKGIVALILLFDQFPRNIYRGDPKSFSFDPKALEITKELISNGKDKELKLIERAFCYLPLEHSETLEDQTLCVKKFEELVDEAPENLKGHFRFYLQYAVEHKQVIEQFGRFPHRNEILGREETEEERDFDKKF